MLHLHRINTNNLTFGFILILLIMILTRSFNKLSVKTFNGVSRVLYVLSFRTVRKQ